MLEKKIFRINIKKRYQKLPITSNTKTVLELPPNNIFFASLYSSLPRSSKVHYTQVVNILHLLSQNHLTGAEVYAVALARQQIGTHTVHQVSNGFFCETPAHKLQLDVETRSRLHFLRNVLTLRRYLSSHRIDVIHTHSRAAVKLAWWATRFTDVATVSTVHGVQHSSFSKKLHNQYGQFIVAVCENIKTHLVRDFHYSPRNIKVIPNGIDPALYNFQPRPLKEIKKVAIIGRTTGPKGDRTAQALEQLLSPALAHLNLQITLIGGTKDSLKLSPTAQPSLHQVQQLPDGTELNSHVYTQYDLVIGSGRVCMEALLSGVRTIAFGEALYEGPVRLANFNAVITSNFGDIHPDHRAPQLPSAALVEALLNPWPDEAEHLAQLAQEHFSLTAVATKVMRLYESAVFLKKHPSWIPVLMYHKIPDHEIQSQHRIFVTKQNFERHLKFFKWRGLQTLTFSDLKKFRTGQKDWSQFPKKPLILTFDDGYRDNLENASPLLKKYNYRAQLFLLADPKVNSNRWDISDTEPVHEIISGPERQKWKESAFEIGSHGFSHKKLTELTTQEAMHELRESKASLEKEFGQTVDSFAFTYGITTADAPTLAEKAGYDYAVNTDSGGLLHEEEPHAIFRVNIFPDESLWSLFKKTSSWYRRYYYNKRRK